MHGNNKIHISKTQAYVSFEHFNAFSNKKLVRAMDEFEDRVVIKMSSVPMLEFKKEELSNEDVLAVMREFFLLTE